MDLEGLAGRNETSSPPNFPEKSGWRDLIDPLGT